MMIQSWMTIQLNDRVAREGSNLILLISMITVERRQYKNSKCLLPVSYIRKNNNKKSNIFPFLYYMYIFQ